MVSTEDLVMTHAEVVPPPNATPDAYQRPQAGGDGHGLSDDVLCEVQHLADKVGGLHRLRDLIGELESAAQ